MDPIRVLVRRGATVESVHLVHGVAVQGLDVVATAGDPRLVTFMRSAAKPFQALPLARARDDLDDRDLAIASASHLAGDEQLAAVRALLAKAPAAEDELECGPAGWPPERIRHNCSGKHAGMLALCRARGWAGEGYRLAGHPVQVACHGELAEAAQLEPAEVEPAVDGCGVLTFALTLERIAIAFAGMEERDEGASVAAAMRAYPELIRGPGAPDTVLMQRLPGWTAKGGAEGLLCASGPGGLGLALKVSDGNGRAVGPALATFLARLGLPVPELAVQQVSNSRGEPVGEIAAIL
jgi:L-asparaginase